MTLDRNAENLLEVKDLQVSFSTYAGEVAALRGVDFELKRGETLALVGESGSGKSITSKSIMGLLPGNGQIKAGEIRYQGKNLLHLSEKQWQHIRGNEIAMIFQDPMTSLDPTMTIGKQVAESLRLHAKVTKQQALERAAELLDLVGIPEAKKRMKDYPHQFSGGQRQRIVIAIALICQPEILIADEPTTALDVTIQAQILELLKEIQTQSGTSILFITHDLGVVANVADRVAVMYAGRIVEIGTAEEIFYYPQHPYTWGLLSSMPSLDMADEKLFMIPGTPPDGLNPPTGDAFYPRNDYALKIDKKLAPPFFEISETHKAATWLLAPEAPKVTPPAEILKRYRYFEAKQKGGGAR